MSDDNISCDVCGQEENEEVVDEEWLSFSKPRAFEVIVCTECAADPKSLEKAFQIFAGELG